MMQLHILGKLCWMWSELDQDAGVVARLEEGPEQWRNPAEANAARLSEPHDLGLRAE